MGAIDTEVRALFDTYLSGEKKAIEVCTGAESTLVLKSGLI